MEDYQKDFETLSRVLSDLPFDPELVEKLRDENKELKDTISVLRRIFLAAIRTDDCIEWTGSKNKHGYGLIHVGGHRNGKTKVVSRIVGRICIPGNGHVLHTCDNRACFNPRHLYRGTEKDNSRDREQRNPIDRRGIHNGRSLLTDDDVRSIRAMRKAGEGKAAIAKLFHVSPHTVDGIVRGRKWKHIL